MPIYEDISSKEWGKLLDLDYPPNVKDVVTKMHAFGRRAIVPANEVMSCFSTVKQVNQAFIKNQVLFRLRIVQGGYPNGTGYPNGYLVQLVKKFP